MCRGTRTKERPAKCKRKRVCARRCFAAMLVGKNAHVHLVFSSEWLWELNNLGSAHIVLSGCANGAGLISSKIFRGFSSPYRPSHEPVGCLCKRVERWLRHTTQQNTGI